MSQYTVTLSDEERKALLVGLDIPKFFNAAMLGEFTVSLDSEEEKALLTDMLLIQDYLNNAIHNKARQEMDKVILEHSDRQAKKISTPERLQIIRDADVETAADRQARMEGELRDR